MSFIRRTLARPRSEARSLQSGSGDPWAIPAPGQALGAMASSGAMVNADSALSILAMYRGVQLLADIVSGLPLRAVTQDASGVRTPLVDKPPQITDPFHGLTLQEGVSQITVSSILRGNAYGAPMAGQFVGGSTFQRRRILDPDAVDVRWGKDGQRVYMVGGREWAWPMDHVTGFMLPGQPAGASLITYARNALGAAIALDDVAGAFFQNGVMSQGIIAVDYPLDEDDSRALAQQFVQNHGGITRAHLPVVMGGGAKYQPMSLTPEDAQFIQSRQFTEGQIATLLGIPPHLLGIVDKTTSWGSGIEEQGRAFLQYTLRPHLKRLETMFTRWLPAGVYAEFVTDDLTRADSTQRNANYLSALTAGWLNADEVRNREGLPPIPDGKGQVYRHPVTQSPADPSPQDGDAPDDGTPAAPIPTDNAATDQEGRAYAGAAH